MTENKKMELYFHIPFCVRKCLYCDFLSAPGSRAQIEAYMEALLTETRKRAGEYTDRTVTSIFLGGGTPSVVPPQKIQELMDTVRGSFRLSKDAEITMEVNPGTADEERLAAYYEAGINRLSIGLQSADEKELSALGRIHSFSDFLNIWEAGRRIGFSNMSVDLMSAIPGQTIVSWRETL